jgi:hypothetical protein
VVKHLLVRHKALSSKPSTARKKNKISSTVQKERNMIFTSRIKMFIPVVADSLTAFS